MLVPQMPIPTLREKKMVRYSEDQMIALIKEQFDQQNIVILAPIVRARKGHYRELFDQVRKQGFNKVRLDGKIIDLSPGLQTDRFKIHDIEIVIDRMQVKEERMDRLSYSIQTALKMGNDVLFILGQDNNIGREKKNKKRGSDNKK